MFCLYLRFCATKVTLGLFACPGSLWITQGLPGCLSQKMIFLANASAITQMHDALAPWRGLFQSAICIDPPHVLDRNMRPLTHKLAVLTLFALCLMTALPGTAQDRGGEDRGERDDRRQRWEDMSEEERDALRKRFEERRAEMEKQRVTELKEQLEMSDDEFEVISPLIEKVRTVTRERDMVANSRGGRGAPGQRGGGGFGGELSKPAQAVTQAIAELRQAVEDDNSGDIKDALAKLRKSRAEMDKLVKDAREELRAVCTAKWEAQFVIMGLLD